VEQQLLLQALQIKRLQSSQLVASKNTHPFDFAEGVLITPPTGVVDCVVCHE
jgi:hypothetical protein